MTGAPRDPWLGLAARTPARVALGRAGSSLPTGEVLSFALAHARARDAIHATLDRHGMAGRLAAIGLPSLTVESEATDRATYLRRPDLGRRLSRASGALLDKTASPEGWDLAIVVGDGLSATAVGAHAVELITAAMALLAPLGLRVGPVVLALGTRVALGDDIGARLRARLVVVVIGERPGLSAIDSVGAYLTYDPQPGRNDAERNCISNIRGGGLAPELAARNLAWLVEAALSRRLTGVALKDQTPALGRDGPTEITRLQE
jgi:ethanolamine ammonia-lyase small subunit